MAELLILACAGWVCWALYRALFRARRGLRRGRARTERPAPPPSRPPAVPPTPRATARSFDEIKSVIGVLPKVRVIRIVDGDTLVVAPDDWSQITVRLDSIDCPEDGQPWGDEASEGLRLLVGGRFVAFEAHGVDRHGRTLATLYAKNAEGLWQNVNERMVARGHAWVSRTYFDHLPPDRQDRLERLEAWAISGNVGLWGAGAPVAPWLWRAQANGGADVARSARRS